jgi:hypothetical protein
MRQHVWLATMFQARRLSHAATASASAARIDSCSLVLRTFGRVSDSDHPNRHLGVKVRARRFAPVEEVPSKAVASGWFGFGNDKEFAFYVF